MKKPYLLLVIPLLLASACSRNYFLADRFEEKTADHRTIAILPFEVIHRGEKPDALSEEDQTKLLRQESRWFTQSFYDRLLRSTRGGRKPLRVDVQSLNKTTSRLEGNDLQAEDTWRTPPTELAKMLEADAVVAAKVELVRYLPDLASYGIDMGIEIAEEVLEENLRTFLPRDATKTNDVRVSLNLIDGETGNTLFSESALVEIDWRWSRQEIVEHINRRISRHFPYRN